MKLLTEQLNYNFATNEGFFDTKASITNEEKSLWSNKGVYYSSIEKFDFFGDVLIIEGEEIIKADTLYYWLDSEFASFRSNGEIENSDIKILAQEGWIDQIAGNAFLSDRIKITQSKDSYTLYTDTCIITDQMNHSLSYGNTLLNFPFNDDTLYLTADTLINYQTTASTIVKAYKDVNFKSTTITGQSDSLSFNTQSNLIYLNQEPVLWLEEFQLTADTISLFLDSNKLEKVYLNKNAFISSELDSISFNQISGINMLANFKENDLHSINVMGNGESIYYIQDDVTDEILGLNKIICSNMNIRIDDRALKNIKFLQKPDATLFPIAEIKEPLRWLKHYNNRNKLAVLNKIETKTQVHKGF
jgi:lipopolysaccharide export system protein LptA